MQYHFLLNYKLILQPDINDNDLLYYYIREKRHPKFCVLYTIFSEAKERKLLDVAGIEKYTSYVVSSVFIVINKHGEIIFVMRIWAQCNCNDSNFLFQNNAFNETVNIFFSSYLYERRFRDSLLIRSTAIYFYAINWTMRLIHVISNMQLDIEI